MWCLIAEELELEGPQEHPASIECALSLRGVFQGQTAISTRVAHNSA